MRIFSTKFEGCCKYFSPIKLVSFYQDLFNKNGMDFVTEISFCKNLLLMKKGWFLEVESQLGKSFKVSLITASHSHLLYSSLHPSHVKNSIPYSPLLRLRRLCCEDSDFLRSTKWNASLILACECAELAALCKLCSGKLTFL